MGDVRTREKPSTWDATYGTAPYTSGNDVLWNAIATQPGRYGKPDIKNYLPVDASGNLLDPIAAGLIDALDIPGRRSGWKVGDQAPAETSWRRSSAYPFTVIKTLALNTTRLDSLLICLIRQDKQQTLAETR